jgi:hypothetical protein
MAPPVRAGLGLPSLPVEDSGHGFIALPDRSTIAIPADTALAGAWTRLSGQRCPVAAFCTDRGNANRQSWRVEVER